MPVPASAATGCGARLRVTPSVPESGVLARPGVDEHDLERLEFPEVRASLAAHTASERGRRMALALRPAAEIETARERLDALREAKRRAEEHGDGPAAGVAEITPYLERATARRRLEGAELVRVLELLEAAGRLRRHWAEPPAVAPRTRAAVAKLCELPRLETALRRAVAEDGTLRDGASRELARLRARQTAVRQAARGRLERLAREAGGDSAGTVREDRFVLSVRSDRFDRARGVVQDVSASGATLFVEPFELVPLNNELRELAAAEREEERRILDALTAEVAAHADSLAAVEEGVAELDELAARVRLSRALRATTPALDERGERLHIAGGRHPLLWLQSGGASDPEAAAERVVAFDLDLVAPARVLLVSGPNMGGKTVLLKAVGLAVLMALSGLDVCAAEGAVLPHVCRVLVDIGDQQSLADHLSTFAGRLRRMDEMARAAAPSTLCLLDELGSGTDPEEGTALGRGLLEHLAERGAWTVATTHLGGLKGLASERPHVVNASLGIDAVALRPLFVLQVGVPGGSYGLATARRLGLADEVLRRAEASVREEAIALERLLGDLSEELRRVQETRALLETERAEAARERAAGEEARRAAESTQRERERRRSEELAALEARARELVRSAEREWRRAGEARAGAETGSLRRGAQALGADLDAWRAASPGEPPAAEPAGPLAHGMRVRHTGLGLTMQIVEGPRADGSVVLARGAWRVTARPEELSRCADGAAERPPEERLALSELRAETSAPWEVDLRGLYVDEALAALDAALDRAALAGHREFRVIHGVGSGALQKAVARHLADHPHVQSHRLGGHGEGGRGVTMAVLA